MGKESEVFATQADSMRSTDLSSLQPESSRINLDSSSSQPRSSKVNILLVDDNVSNLLALETILQADDRNLVRAASGDDALLYLLRNDVAVILLDVRMPGISGLETAELIRGRQRSRDVPIIFLTAYDSTDNAELCKGYSLGAVDYIIKPFDPDTLKSKVNVFVELFKKTEQVKQQAALLHEKTIQLENANFQRLGKLVELGQRMTSLREPDQLLEAFCNAARDILSAESAWVLISDSTKTHARVSERADAGPGSAVDIETIHQRLYDSGNATQAIRLSRREITDLTRPFPANRRLTSLLAAPIRVGDEKTGCLYLGGKLDADEFSEADERLAMTLTGQFAVAYENARLYADARSHSARLLAEITDRKIAQEQNEKLLISEKSARLEAERAHMLSSQLLARETQARADAESASRLKDEFLATLSHELRTPLNSILGWVHLLGTGSIDEATACRALQTIERNTRSLAKIIDDLLDVSRIITGKLRLEVRPIELPPVIDAALDAIRPASDAKKIRLIVALDNSIGMLSGDPNRLQQIVWNLLSNAIKFTPSGGQVEIRLERIESNARITVTDTGEGIDGEFIPFVFDRFRQADSSFARLHGGLGLGLAIVRHLVEMHGGAVKADSPGKGKGATFVATLPLLTSTLAGNDLDLDPLISDHFSFDLEPTSLNGLRVLVVDDEQDARDILIAVLQQCGASVVATGSARDAIAVMCDENSSFVPDVLISDIGMPTEDGFDLIARVRALRPEQGGAIPAIALTAYARPEDRIRILNAGFQSHIAKPVTPSVLATVVADLARRRGSIGFSL